MEVRTVGWRIYYGDGGSVDSRELSWRRAMSLGVLVVVVFQVDERGKPARMVLAYHDFYWMEQGEIRQGNERPASVSPLDVKLGALVPNDFWESIRVRAWADERLEP